MRTRNAEPDVSELFSDQSKIRRVKEAMQTAGLDALLLRIPENVSYLSGAWCGQGLTYLIFPLEKDPILIYPANETLTPTWVSDVRSYSNETVRTLGDPIEVGLNEVQKALTDLGIGRGKIGIEKSWELIAGTYVRYEMNVVGETRLSALVKNLAHRRPENVSRLLIEMRAVKTAEEVRKLRRVNRVAEVGLRTFSRNLKPRISEVELAGLVENDIVSFGITEHKMNKIIACAFISSGPTTADAHRYAFGNTRRKLRRGDLVMLELDVVADGYSSDTTRTFVVGKPNRQQRLLFEAVLDSQTSAVAAIKPGVSAAEIARISNDTIRRHGLSKYLVHGLGHGIGVAIHESIPTLHLASKDILRPGMVHSVEPGIYGRKIGGIRIEDDILDTDRGSEYLSTFQRIPE